MILMACGLIDTSKETQFNNLPNTHTHTHTHQIVTKDVILPKHLLPDVLEVICHVLQNSILNQCPTFAYCSTPMMDNLTANWAKSPIYQLHHTLHHPLSLLQLQTL